MKNRFGVARCCCENFCEDCCNGNAPTEWDVDLALTSGECDTCEEYIGGTFTLARVGPVICKWEFSRSSPIYFGDWSQNCEEDYLRYGYVAERQRMDLEVRCVSATEYRIRFTQMLETRYNTGQEYDEYGNAFQTRFFTGSLYLEYATTVNFNDFICDEQTDYEVPFVRAFMTANFQWLRETQILPPPLPPFREWIPTMETREFTTLPIGEQTFAIDPGIFGGASWNWVTNPICEPPASILITAIP